MHTNYETLRGERQQGKWQVFGKVRDAWTTFGDPSSQARAEELVETMRVENRVGQVHCVPL